MISPNAPKIQMTCLRSLPAMVLGIISVGLVMLTACGGGSSSPAPTAAPIANLAPANLIFGSQPVGSTSATQTITLSNSGTAVLSILTIAATGDFSQSNNCGASLASGANCALTVAFTPTAGGTRNGSLTVTDSATGSPHSASLVGLGAAPLVSLAPAMITFANQMAGTTSAAQTITLTNTGSATLNLTGITVTGDFVQSSNCGASLGVAAACTISVNFSPTAVGLRSGSLMVTDDASGSPQSVPLSGTGLTTQAISVSIHPTLAAIVAQRTQTFSATLLGDAQFGLTWAVDGLVGGNAAVGVVSSTGVYVAPGTAGVHTVTATSVADPTKSASASLAVTDLPGVFTYHNDLARDGANSQEYGLTPATVQATTFGKLFACPVDGVVYAQPLWVPNLMIGGGLRNVIFIATQHDSIYAFDADTSPCTQLWHANLLDAAHGAGAAETPVSVADVGYGFEDIQPEIGVTGTPVIDPASGTLYVVSKSKSSSTSFYQRLHALALTTGAEQTGAPVLIAAQTPGTGDGSSGGQVVFDPHNQHQRSGLALVNGIIYIAWASHEDRDPYHGWLIAYDATSLQQLGAFNSTPNGSRGGMWMSGAAPAADSAGSLYLTTGNGSFESTAAMGQQPDFGDSVLRFGGVFPLTVADWFTPFNQYYLNNTDQDVSSSGVVVLPDTTTAFTKLMVSSSKEGRIYLLNRDSLGAFCLNCQSYDTNTVQSIQTGTSYWGAPAFWQNQLYYGATDSVMTHYTFDPVQGMFGLSPTSQTSAFFHFPGPTPAVSAQGSSSGIVWALDVGQYGVPSHQGSGPAILHAYDATNLANELWNSSQAAANRDKAGDAVKFTVPTIANGKVYIGTRTEIDVYGLLPN